MDDTILFQLYFYKTYLFGMRAAKFRRKYHSGAAFSLIENQQPWYGKREIKHQQKYHPGTQPSLLENCPLNSELRFYNCKLARFFDSKSTAKRKNLVLKKAKIAQNGKKWVNANFKVANSTNAASYFEKARFQKNKSVKSPVQVGVVHPLAQTGLYKKMNRREWINRAKKSPQGVKAAEVIVINKASNPLLSSDGTKITVIDLVPGKNKTERTVFKPFARHTTRTFYTRSMVLYTHPPTRKAWREIQAAKQKAEQKLPTPAEGLPNYKLLPKLVVNHPPLNKALPPQLSPFDLSFAPKPTKNLEVTPRPKALIVEEFKKMQPINKAYKHKPGIKSIEEPKKTQPINQVYKHDPVAKPKKGFDKFKKTQPITKSSKHEPVVKPGKEFGKLKNLKRQRSAVAKETFVLREKWPKLLRKRVIRGLKIAKQLQVQSNLFLEAIRRKKTPFVGGYFEPRLVARKFAIKYIARAMNMRPTYRINLKRKQKFVRKRLKFNKIKVAALDARARFITARAMSRTCSRAKMFSRKLKTYRGWMKRLKKVKFRFWANRSKHSAWDGFKARNHRNDWKTPTNLEPAIRPVISFNFFFTYFFLHFFKYESIILYKSLYKMLFSCGFISEEFGTILFRTQYLQGKRWFFDFVFFTNYAFTFANTTILFPFFVYHLITRFKHRGAFMHFFNLLRSFYYFKLNIRGIKLLINGPYDRHGRSRSLVLKIGDSGITVYNSPVIYDSIQSPTLYGTINIKFWLQYFDLGLTTNWNLLNKARPPSSELLPR